MSVERRTRSDGAAIPGLGVGVLAGRGLVGNLDGRRERLQAGETPPNTRGILKKESPHSFFPSMKVGVSSHGMKS